MILAPDPQKTSEVDEHRTVLQQEHSLWKSKNVKTAVQEEKEQIGLCHLKQSFFLKMRLFGQMEPRLAGTAKCCSADR